MLWLDVAGRRHERRLGARGQQRLDAAERAALVLELGLEFGLGLACGRSIGRLGRCIGLPRCTGVLPIAAPKGGHWSNGAEAVQRCRGGSVHLARDPERSRAVAEAVVDARLPGARMQGVGLRPRAAGGGVCVRGSPPNLYGRPRLRLRAALPGSICLARRRCCWAAGRVWLALTSCVMSLTMLRASRRTAPSFPFSHASYSFSESEPDLLPDSILRGQPQRAAHGGTAVVDVAV